MESFIFFPFFMILKMTATKYGKSKVFLFDIFPYTSTTIAKVE